MWPYCLDSPSPSVVVSLQALRLELKLRLRPPPPRLYRIRNFAELEGPRRLEMFCTPESELLRFKDLLSTKQEWHPGHHALSLASPRL